MTVGRVALFSPGIARIPDLEALLDADRAFLFPRRPGPFDAVAGWGRKPNTRWPRRVAAITDKPFLTLEDGFLRSVGLGVHGDPPLSIVVDAVGCHYDATRPSALERMLADDPLDDPALLSRARACIDAIRAHGLSKYNDAPDHPLGARDRPRVLVVDQTVGDLSLTLGGCDATTFDAMLGAALAEHPDAEIVVKTHPDVLAGARAGNLARPHARVRLLTAPCNPSRLLDEVDHVFTMTSLMGAEALLANKPVTCFGAPFYAGWGLTDDRGPVPSRRGRALTVEQLFLAAYLRYPRYVDPETGAPCEAERVIEHLAHQRRVGASGPRRVVGVGFSVWKRDFVPRFVHAPGGEVAFARGPAGARRALTGAPDEALLVWGVKEPAAIRDLAEARGVPLLRMEDGFLRSVGLGVDLHAPASLVVDARGIYYDPATESDLEAILATIEIGDDERARARSLRAAIVEARVSKYNVGVARRVGPGDGRRVALVVGQVEGDASIQRGAMDVRQNEALLREARASTDAYLIYKPHPDTVSGNRPGTLSVARASELADEVVTDASLADCLAAADDVHTMTSLVGFEALLRDKRVRCYGQPFYAGWGLTDDRHPHPRRTRRLDLDQLVAGVLLRYPRYVHPRTGRYTTPEAIVQHLSTATSSKSAWAAPPIVQKAANLARALDPRGGRR